MERLLEGGSSSEEEEKIWQNIEFGPCLHNKNVQ